MEVTFDYIKEHFDELVSNTLSKSDNVDLWDSSTGSWDECFSDSEEAKLKEVKKSIKHLYVIAPWVNYHGTLTGKAVYQMMVINACPYGIYPEIAITGKKFINGYFSLNEYKTLKYDEYKWLLNESRDKDAVANLRMFTTSEEAQTALNKWMDDYTDRAEEDIEILKTIIKPPYAKYLKSTFAVEKRISALEAKKK